jgi:hypothetical protein
MSTPRERAYNQATELEYITRDRRLEILNKILGASGVGIVNPQYEQVDALIASHVRVALADYLERYSSWPITPDRKQLIYLGFYKVAADSFASWLKKQA